MAHAGDDVDRSHGSVHRTDGPHVLLLLLLLLLRFGRTARGERRRRRSAAPKYADAPLDVDVINRVFDEDRDWWPDVFFKLENRACAPVDGAKGVRRARARRLRAKFIVLRVLFPRRAPEQYESVYERLENIAKHRDSGASFKAYASALKTRAQSARLYAETKTREEKETPKARRDDGAEG